MFLSVKHLPIQMALQGSLYELSTKISLDMLKNLVGRSLTSTLTVA